MFGTGKRGFVFTSDGSRALSGFSKFKKDFDEASGLTDWDIHDLRRTARTLMARIGISEEHAERAIGHTEKRLVKNYTVWDFREEKSEVFRKLSDLIERITTPHKNVLEFSPTQHAVGG